MVGVVATEVMQQAIIRASGEIIATVSSKSAGPGTRKNIDNVEHVAASIENATMLSVKSGESLTQILAFVDQVNDQVQSIATASEEQSATSEEINRSVEQIATISAETAQASSWV